MAHAEKFGDVSIHHLTDELDEGNIITQARFRIELWDTPWDIIYRYSDLFAILLCEALLLLDYGYDETTPNEGGRCYLKGDVPWARTIKHSLVNRTLRLVGSDSRWEIEPTHA